MAKAVYLAESALLADSRPNMNKLAVQLQQQSGLSFEDLTSAATNVRALIPQPDAPCAEVPTPWALVVKPFAIRKFFFF